MKKIICALLCLLASLSLFACDMEIDVSVNVEQSVTENESEEASREASEEASEEESIVQTDIGLSADDTVVFLGDSIAQGYGLADVENERYSSLIAAEYGCTVYNYAIPGDDGADLLALLDEGTCTELANATVIVLSIGANNVLKAADTLAPYLPDAENGELPENVDVSATFDVVVAGIDRFKTELPQIIQKIREVNADAQIIFQTVYNPYRDFTEYKVEQNGLQLSFAAFSASCVIGINDVIKENAAGCGYTVCEVYEPFKEYQGNLINAIADGSDIDPHPNAEGHRQLAILVAGAVK